MIKSRMEKRRLLLLAIAAGIVLALGIPCLVFFTRAPVLVVSDISFVSLYGAGRVRLERARASLALFRPVKPIVIADDAGDDIAYFAIGEASSRPFCVLFPVRFSGAAGFYRERFPEIPVAILEGRGTDRNQAALDAGESAAGNFFLFATDMESDFYRAGLCAAILDGDKNGRIVVFLDDSIQSVGREAFLRGLRDQGKETEPLFFTSFSELSGFSSGISCVVLAGSGAEFLEKNQEIPIILFTWLNTAFIPENTVLVFDDSPWAQAVPAVRLAASRTKIGRIPSKTLILSAKSADKYMLQKIKKAADTKKQI
jgi:hypothetical protein